MNSNQTITGLIRAFDLQSGEVIGLVGGGGKTTLMFALARELVLNGNPVVTTTTTKILEPSPDQTPLLIVEPDEKILLNTLKQNIGRYKHITVAAEKLPLGKLKGISPELIVKLAQLASYIIVEADGAARKPLKAPNATEPVIPASTSLVIPVVGIDAIGCRLTEDNVFRSAIASKLLGLPLGEVVTAEAIATLITHPRGIIKGSPSNARIIPFLNKTDLDPGLSKSRDLAKKILKIGYPRIKKVVLGQAQSPSPVVEVIQNG